jgi:peptidyl-prolyl cis-trans isomerase C
MILALGLAVTVAATAGGGQEQEEQDTQQETEQDERGDSTGGQADGQQSDGGGAVDVDGEPVAVVNGVALSNQRFNDAVQRNELQMRRQSRGQPVSETQLNDMKANILEGMINEEVLYQHAEEQGVAVSDSEVDERIEQYRSQYGEDGFADALSRAGMTEEELRREIRRSLTIQQLLEEEVTGDIEVTESEQREFYDENTNMFAQPESVTASHILISTQEAESEEARQEALERAEELKTQLEEGADFAELAREHSEGPSASRGGSLGQFSRGQMVPPFEEAAFALEPGEISDVVETRFGYHIIKVDEKNDGGTTPYEEVKGQIGQYLEQQRQQEAVQSYIDELKADADIERNVSFG